MRNSEELGKWIWLADAAGVRGDQQPVRNCYVYFRKLINLPARPSKAHVKIAADSKYKLYVNGTYVGKGPARAPAGAAYYDTHDIAGLLTRGANVVAALVHYFGEPTYAGPPGAPGLNCRVEIDPESRSELVVISDETWKALRAPDWTDQGDRINESLGFQEVYDASARVDGWSQAKFDDAGWENAAVTVGSRLLPRPIPQLREERIPPKTVVGTFNCNPRGREAKPGAIPQAMSLSALSELTAGSVKGVNSLISGDGVTQVRTPRGETGVAIVLDFGREVFGDVEIGIAGSSGGCVDIGYAELLEDGRVKPDRDGAKYTDRIILGRGRFRWQSFEPRAFRYMQIEFRRLGRPAVIEYVRVNRTAYPVRAVGSFECSDSLLNEIRRTAAYTTELCMEDSLISSPRSDRSLCWADVRLTARAAYYAFGDTALPALALRQAAETQTDDGALRGIAPPSFGEPPADLMLLWVLSVLEYYAFSDDLDLVRDLYPSVRRLMEWFGRHVGGDCLLSGVPGSVFIDDADVERRGTVTALNCLYCHTLRAAGALARLLGLEAEAEQWQAAADRVKPAINKYLYSPRRGLYAECIADTELVEKYTTPTNIFAALFDIADHYTRASILRQIRTGSLPEPATTYMASYLVEALCAADLHEEALELMRRMWGSMLREGATTFGERFDGRGTLCRGWAVGPVRELAAEYVGIKPTLEANRFTVAPHTAGLAWARGSIGTKMGPLAVEWKATRRHLLINVDVPDGVKVDVYPPGAASSRFTLDGRDYPSRFITLEGGSHTIKVEAGPPRRPLKTDEALEPRPVPHVEILGELFPRGLRRVRIGTGERRAGARSRRTRDQRPDILRDGKPPETQPEEAAVATADEAQADTSSRKTSQRRPRRGGRKRPRTNADASDAGRIESGTASDQAAPVDAQHDPQTQKEKPSRRGARRPRTSGTRESEAPESTAAPPEAPEPADQPDGGAAAQHPRPRRRRRPSRKTAGPAPGPDSPPPPNGPAENGTSHMGPETSSG